MSRGWPGIVLWAFAATAAVAGASAGEAVGFPRLAAMAPQVLAKGPQASLPAHLAGVLGLGDRGGPVPVRQAVQRQAGDVHVFNVLAAEPHSVVLMRVSEASSRTEVFLVDSQGALLRAVGYEGGGQARDLPPAGAATAYEREARFWLQIGARRP